MDRDLLAAMYRVDDEDAAPSPSPIRSELPSGILPLATVSAELRRMEKRLDAQERQMRRMEVHIRRLEHKLRRLSQEREDD